MSTKQNESAATIRTVRTPPPVPPVPPRTRLARVVAAIVWPLDRCAAFAGPELTGILLGILLTTAACAVSILAASVT